PPARPAARAPGERGPPLLRRGPAAAAVPRPPRESPTEEAPAHRGSRGEARASDHHLMPWIRLSTLVRSLGSSCSRVWILLTACRTVVWSLPPKARPTSASEACVSCRARYIAIWRGRATAFVRDRKSVV